MAAASPHQQQRQHGVAVLGIFVADLAFRAADLPGVGQTIAGSGFAMGPGGKGSNQSVAAARAGARVTFISKLGQDSFGANALALWAQEGITPRVPQVATQPTGAAFIYVHEVTGDNAIIVVPGAAALIDSADVDAAADAIRGARVFVTQLEQPAGAAQRGLELARAAGTVTVFNPAPALPFDDAVYALCDYITPNEHEAAALSGIAVETIDDARRAGDFFLSKGVGCALITLGEKGALLHSAKESVHLPVFHAGAVKETAGAGDAFNGGFAAALAEGASPLEAARFGSAVAAISVTRAGTAPSMPTRAEVDALLGRVAA
ncbi:ribokinase [Variovorax sp. NFACC27]|uniref:ribokinase n=1 Tax=unclassified Variovorax TaxID=663243 RepID=UPI000894BCD7|nr:ribokinase [Variovorax sp. NFACC28]SEG86909.1 ribokinase [Variovorax sp. NFACC29]SFD30271.1 ribokinase [Variovorax sp. NFACC26]SFG32577.1 ribokinase [Variovorax sp. NFACC27]